MDYETFQDLGSTGRPPPGYKKIRVHFVYDIKHDLRYKACLVADGHLTNPGADQAYSGVVSLKSLRLALLIGELNGLQTMVGDIGNAYLEAKTKEKVYFIAGPKFGDLRGHIMIIDKALYGLRTSGAHFHERLADTLRAEGFQPSLADPDLWYCDIGHCYEYICVYVDDLCMCGENPSLFFDTLITKYNYKLKGVGEIGYHLGGNFSRDKDSTLTLSCKTYIDKLMANYNHYFGSEPPRKWGAPIEDGDHPELDDSTFLDEAGIKLYQSMIGALQWCVTLGRFDIQFAVMSMSCFHIEPCVNHIK